MFVLAVWRLRYAYTHFKMKALVTTAKMIEDKPSVTVCIPDVLSVGRDGNSTGVIESNRRISLRRATSERLYPEMADQMNGMPANRI